MRFSSAIIAMSAVTSVLMAVVMFTAPNWLVFSCAGTAVCASMVAVLSQLTIRNLSRSL